MPQLTDRSKLPNIVDPVIKDTMDLRHLYQVHTLYWNSISVVLITFLFLFVADKLNYVLSLSR